MVSLKRSEKRVIDDAFDMHGGYVLNFSDRTFAEFFEDEFSIEIYTEKYAFNGSSKAKHLRAFIEIEDAYTVSRVLRTLWEYRENILRGPIEEEKDVKTPLFDLLSRIEGALAVAARKQNGMGLQTGPVSGPDYLQIERFLDPLYVQTGPLYRQQTCKQPFRPTLSANNLLKGHTIFKQLIFKFL
ncbi:MAG: hypothetical protein KDJ34_12150 [Candidatus Competibacteraceae bacterium]|nr:hypothetical protein [Candidatus Competibacteraceae bacterium]MCP5134812.1 hypothetical protein [Gammaproteobacteria bacterium]